MSNLHKLLPCHNHQIVAAASTQARTQHQRISGPRTYVCQRLHFGPRHARRRCCSHVLDVIPFIQPISQNVLDCGQRCIDTSTRKNMERCIGPKHGELEISSAVIDKTASRNAGRIRNRQRFCLWSAGKGRVTIDQYDTAGRNHRNVCNRATVERAHLNRTDRSRSCNETPCRAIRLQKLHAAALSTAHTGDHIRCSIRPTPGRKRTNRAGKRKSLWCRKPSLSVAHQKIGRRPAFGCNNQIKVAVPPDVGRPEKIRTHRDRRNLRKSNKWRHHLAGGLHRPLMRGRCRSNRGASLQKQRAATVNDVTSDKILDSVAVKISHRQ